MQIDSLNVLVTVLTLIILAVPGFLLAKGKLLPDKASEAFSTLVLYGCQPVMVFMSFQGKEYSPEIGLNMLIVAGIAIVVHLIMYCVAYFIIRNKDASAKKRSARYGCIFGNCGYMGLPLIQSLFYGQDCLSEAIIYTAVIIAVFNVFNWTFGVYIASDDKRNISVKKILLNPTIIGIVLGFLVYVTVKIPLADLAVSGSKLDMAVEKVMNSFNTIGNTVTPLSMTVIGIRLANVNFKQLFMDKTAYLVCAVKLIGMSIVTMLLVAFLPVNEVVKYTAFFLFSMPCATSTALFAVKFGGDGDFASVCVLLTTILSILTIPLMYVVFGLLL
ncbi:MAG: AEC family transporter [Clostridia bacterium]|nr:AEC family transporter [Clostridia bacterium]